MISTPSPCNLPRHVFAVALVWAVMLGASAIAQTASEHESHHPAQPAEQPAAGEPDSPATGMDPKGGMSGTAGMGGMGEMMNGMMGVSPRKEIYPSLMDMRGVTPERRAELDRLARARMSSGAASMSAALEKLNAAPSDGNLGRMRDAARQMREGVLQFESGVATLQAGMEGKDPAAIGLDWFKQGMDLLPTADIRNPHGILGLSAFHYITMFILAAFATAMIAMNFRKMRRTEALAARLSGSGPQPPSTEGAPSATPAVSPLHPVVPPPTVDVPASIKTQDAPSKANSWTGLLRVVRTFDETPNVRTLRLADPSGGEIPFRHLPGQFATFTVRPIDQQVKRSYTIASSPTRRDYIEVTVKREDRGTVSSYLHHVHEGDTLQVTGPSGNFTFIGEEANSIVLVSGGVGITPMMSVLRYLTDRSWRGDIFFLFGCQTEHDVIFGEELEYLKRRHPNLHLTIAANAPQSAAWPYSRGFITKELLTQAVPHLETRRVHICGPKPMMEAVKNSLAELGLSPQQIKTEVFIGKERPVTPAEPDVRTADAGPTLIATPQAKADPETQVAVVTFARSNQTALLPSNRTVLEASEDVGVNIAYSCRVGVCGVCKVKLLKGAVTMEVQDALDADDKKNNVILACQAKATADVSVDA